MVSLIGFRPHIAVSYSKAQWARFSLISPIADFATFPSRGCLYVIPSDPPHPSPLSIPNTPSPQPCLHHHHHNNNPKVPPTHHHVPCHVRRRRRGLQRGGHLGGAHHGAPGRDPRRHARSGVLSWGCGGRSTCSRRGQRSCRLGRGGS